MQGTTILLAGAAAAATTCMLLCVRQTAHTKRNKPKLSFGVGTKNRAKLQTVEAVLTQVYGSDGFLIYPHEVSSGVSEQPMTAAECISGAINRANIARQCGGYDYGIGLEGGLEGHSYGSPVTSIWLESGWMAVIDKNGKQGIGTSARFEVKGEVLKRLKEGEEMGAVMNEIENDTDIGQKGGMMGAITNGILGRSQCYQHGLLFALAPFISSQKYWTLRSNR
jgi:inosine/xanthosine triphosphatase